MMISSVTKPVGAVRFSGREFGFTQRHNPKLTRQVLEQFIKDKKTFASVNDLLAALVEPYSKFIPVAYGRKPIPPTREQFINYSLKNIKGNSRLARFLKTLKGNDPDAFKTSSNQEIGRLKARRLIKKRRRGT